MKTKRFAKNMLQGKMICSFVIICFVLLLGTTIACYATGASIPSFGEGTVKVRIYSDYFCPPCKAMEPVLEPVIKDLVQRNIINLTFIDTPFYQFSALYSRYFLFAMNEKANFDHALIARNALIDASNKKIGDPVELESFLNSRGVRIKPFDAKPVFALFEKLLGEDKIDATPTCVIEKDGRKQVLVGAKDIMKALEKLK